MRSDSDYGPLSDIQRNVKLAQSFVSGFTFDTFQADLRTIYAVIRCLEIISEASRRLSTELKARHPNLPRSDIAGAGNIYRHDYEDVLDQIVWRTVQQGLTSIADVVRIELRNSNR